MSLIYRFGTAARPFGSDVCMHKSHVSLRYATSANYRVCTITHFVRYRLAYSNTVNTLYEKKNNGEHDIRVLATKNVWRVHAGRKRP